MNGLILPPNTTSWLEQRATARHEVLDDRVERHPSMREMPGVEDLSIGGAKSARGVILFADLVKSTNLAIRYRDDPVKMLLTLDLLIPALQECVSHFNGIFEKNTGDGILAYFGVEAAADDATAVLRALFAAEAMLWSVEHLVNPELIERLLSPVQITVGADLGDILIARIGVARQQSPIVAVGLAANRAAKIQDSCGPNQARVGEDFYAAAPREIRRLLQSVGVPASWPFTVRKSSSEHAEEVAEAQRRAAESQSTPRRSGGLDDIERFLSIPPIDYRPPSPRSLLSTYLDAPVPLLGSLNSPPPLSVDVSWDRPYRLYRYAR